MWQFAIEDGELLHDGQHMGYGYSGHGEGKNNPAMQAIKFVGPLPSGFYTIGDAVNHPKLGPDAMPLRPFGANVMDGRSGFWIHADSVEHPGEASEGCLVLSEVKRTAIRLSTDRTLWVAVTEDIFEK